MKKIEKVEDKPQEVKPEESKTKMEKVLERTGSVKKCESRQDKMDAKKQEKLEKQEKAEIKKQEKMEAKKTEAAKKNDGFKRQESLDVNKVCLKFVSKSVSFYYDFTYDL